MTNDKVTAEPTPNPESMLFRFPTPITEFEAEYASAIEAEGSPLALKLFGFPWTAKVYIKADALTLTKQDWVDWDILIEPLTELLTEYSLGGQAAITTPPTEDSKPLLDTEEAIAIFEIIEREIRPAVAQDGGDILFQKYENGEVFVRLKGSCSGCPSSTATLRDGVLARLQSDFKDIKDIIPVY